MEYSPPYAAALVRVLCDFDTPEATAAIVAELERWFDPYERSRRPRGSLSGALRGKITAGLCEAALASEKYYVRVLAVRWCAKLPDVERLLAFLTVALKDEHDRVASEVPILLATMGDSRAEGPLIDALGHDDTGVRGEAAFALGILDGRAAQAALIRSLDSERSRYVRETALLSLEAIGLPEGLAVVDSFVGDTDLQAVASNYEAWITKGDEARFVLTLALQRHGDEAMALALLGSEDRTLRGVARRWSRRKDADVRKSARERP